MGKLIPISRKLFDIYALFTREPFVHFLVQEKEFYSDNNGLIGTIVLDKIDNNYSAVLLSRDESRQYRAESINVDFDTIDQARAWLLDVASTNRVFFHEKAKYFDLFKMVVSEDKRHPNFDQLNENVAFQAAKEVLEEISYHYKDIDGNFIEQFQSVNGFDSRLWELYLFCMCREEYFNFSRYSFAPDFLIEKGGVEIALEAVTLSRPESTREDILKVNHTPLSQEEIEEKLKSEMPLKYANALNKKLKKKYWELEHVKDKPLIFAIADFHAAMSMTWSFPALIEYIFGYRLSHKKDDHGNVTFDFMPIEGFTKVNGSVVPAGFFKVPDSEHVSAVLFSATGTISKFNRLGKQAGLGSDQSILVRTAAYHDHDPNAVVPILKTYIVNENSDEKWAEGVSIFHNPNALIKVDPSLFPSAAHHFLVEDKILSIYPDVFTYTSVTNNLISENKGNGE